MNLNLDSQLFIGKFPYKMLKWELRLNDLMINTKLSTAVFILLFGWVVDKLSGDVL
jgi:hypothetical protein